MSIAGIFGSSILSLLSPSTQTPLQKTKQEFQQLGQDLKSGNLSGAQSDITALQQNVAQQSVSASTTAPISARQTGSAISQDSAKLSTDLKSKHYSPVIYLPHNRRMAHCGRTSNNVRRLTPVQTPLWRLTVRRAFRLTRNSPRSLVPENQFCFFQGQANFSFCKHRRRHPRIFLFYRPSLKFPLLVLRPVL